MCAWAGVNRDRLGDKSVPAIFWGGVSREKVKFAAIEPWPIGMQGLQVGTEEG